MKKGRTHIVVHTGHFEAWQDFVDFKPTKAEYQEVAKIEYNNNPLFVSVLRKDGITTEFHGVPFTVIKN